MMSYTGSEGKPGTLNHMVPFCLSDNQFTQELYGTITTLSSIFKAHSNLQFTVVTSLFNSVQLKIKPCKGYNMHSFCTKKSLIFFSDSDISIKHWLNKTFPL